MDVKYFQVMLALTDPTFVKHVVNLIIITFKEKFQMKKKVFLKILI